MGPDSVAPRRFGEQTDWPEQGLRLGRVPLLALGLSCGVLIVALSYLASRAGSGWSGPTFWVGQGVFYATPALILVRRRQVFRAEGLGVALLIPIASFLINEAYSPVQFRFLDEFSHVRTAQAILTTHHLFSPNPALGISPQYPGLEVVTTAVASLSHLSIYVAGTVVVGLAHVLLCVGLYFLFVEVTGRVRIGALAVLIYSTQPHFQFFDSYFIYESMALPLLVASLLAMVRMLKTRRRGAVLTWGLAALAMAGATIVTHHVTSYVLVALMIVVWVAQWIGRRPSWGDWPLPILILLTVGGLVAWDGIIASGTVAYFTPTVQGLLQALVPHGHGPSVRQPTGPPFDVALEYLSTLLLLLLFLYGLSRLWRLRHRRLGRLVVAFGIASLSLIGALGIRALGSEGSLLYGRAATFFMLVTALPVALAVRAVWLWRLRLKRRRGRVRRGSAWWGGVAVALVLVLGLGGVAQGWPPYYARLPGRFEVEAWERSIDQRNLDLASWAATQLTPSNGFAGDFVTASLLASLGNQAAPQSVAKLFLDQKVNAAVRSLVKNERIAFIAVDRRISTALPATGYYFTNDPHSGDYTSPLPLSDLTKFNHQAGVSRIFEDGDITVYAIRGSVYTAGSGSHS